MKRGLRLAVIFSVLGFVGGCITLTPHQRDTVADVQRFADATAAAYNLVRIPVTVEPSTTQADPCAHLKPGDEWTYWWESPRGSGTFVWSVDREQIIDGTVYYVVRSGATREAYYQKADLAWRMDIVSGVVEVKATPAQLRFVWPLTLSSTWEQTVTIERQENRSTETRTRACHVAGEETVTVAGGTYQTIETVCRDKATDEVIHQAWYAPEVKHWVKEWSRFSWGVQERELMAVKLR